MRIIHIFAGDMESISEGGIASYVRGLIKRCRQESLDVSLVGVTGDRQDKMGGWNKKSIANIEFMMLPILYTTGKHLTYSRGVPLHARFLLRLFLNRNKIVSNCDVLHVHRTELTLPFLMFRKRTPVVLTIHGLSRAIEHAKNHPLYGKTWFRRIVYKIEAFVIKRVDKVILVSQEGMDYYTQTYPDYRNKFVLIPTFVDTTVFNITNNKSLRKRYGLLTDDKVVLFAGRFDYLKGLDLLIESFQKLRHEMPNVKLWLVGDGKEKGCLEKKILDLGLAGIEFKGMVSHDELSRIMNCADIFTMTSLWEGMPLVALEAMACGIPVVSTDVGQMKEIVKDGSTGYLIHSRDSNETAQKMGLALKQAVSMKPECVAMAERYSLPVIAERVFAVYQEM